MSSTHPQRIDEIGPVEELRNELLSTYEAYCELFAEIVKYLKSDFSSLGKGLPRPDRSDANKILVSRSACRANGLVRRFET